MGARDTRITVLAFFNRISLFYTLAPLLLAKDVAARLDFTQSVSHCLQRDRNSVLLIVRYFEGQGQKDEPIDSALMARLRDRYERIAFIDDGAGAACARFEVLPYVDLYLKKHLLRDRSAYMRPLYGRQVFSDHYHRTCGIVDEPETFRVPLPEDAPLDKLQPLWNVGVGSFPVRAFPMRCGVAAARAGLPRLGFVPYSSPARSRVDNAERHDVHARFTVPTRRPSVFHQRRLILDQIGDDSRFLIGPVDQRQYNREIRDSKITLSPFGWGEVCFRDFEAVLNSSLLMKPAMEHLETWPDIYRPGETYVPISWDGEDVLDAAGQWLGDDARRRKVVATASRVYREAQAGIQDRARMVIDRVVNGGAISPGS